MKTACTIILIFSFFITTQAQPAADCPIKKLQATAKKAGTLTESEVKTVLYAYDSACMDKPEYYAVWNKLLLDILEKQTDLTMKTMAKEEAELKMEAILTAIAYPVRKDIDLLALEKKVEAVDMDWKLKFEVASKVRTASRLRKADIRGFEGFYKKKASPSKPAAKQ